MKMPRKIQETTRLMLTIHSDLLYSSHEGDAIQSLRLS